MWCRNRSKSPRDPYPYFMVPARRVVVLVQCILVTAVSFVLGGSGHPSPDEEGQGRVDVYGDPLPPHAIARMGSLRFRALVAIESIAFTTDGRTLATSSSRDENVVLWDAGTGRLLRTLPTREHPLPEEFCGIRDVAFSSDGKKLAACGDSGIVIWEQSTGRILHRYGENGERASFRRITAHGNLFAGAGGDQTLHIWNMGSGREVQRFDLAGMASFALSQDGAVLAAAGWDGTLSLCDVATSQVIRWFPSDALAISIAFAPDGKKVFSFNADGTVRSRDSTTGREVQQVRLMARELSGRPFFSSNCEVIACVCSDASVQICNTVTGRVIRRIQIDPWSFPHVITLSPDGKAIALSSGFDTILQLWDISEGKEIRTFARHQGPVHSVVFSPEGKAIASSGEDGTLRLWDTSTGKELRRMIDGPVVSWSAPLEERDRDLMRSSIGPKGDIAFTLDGKIIISTGLDGTLWFREVATGKRLREVRLEGSGQIYAFAFAPDRKTVAAASEDDGIFRIWSTVTGKEVRRFETTHGGTNRTIAFAPNGNTIASAGDYGSVRLWDTATSRLLDRFTEPRESVQCVAFSPDGETLAVGGVDTVFRLWRPGHGELQRSPERGSEQHIIRSLSFSPNGHWVAWGGEDRIVRIWDARKGQEIGQFHGHQDGINKLAFSPDSHFVSSASNDGTVLVWDVSQVGK